MTIPSVLWPAPGLPALISAADTRLEVIATANGDGVEAIWAWANQLALRDTPEANPIFLHPESVEPIEAGEVGPLAEAAAQLPEVRRQRLFRLRLRAPGGLEPEPPRRARVFDLVASDGLTRTRAVVARRSGSGQLRIAFASDIHLAALWDDIAEAVHRLTPDLSEQLLHPTALLRCFVREINAMAASGEVDALVLGGDLVDHVYTRGRDQITGAPGETNVLRFVHELSQLQVPVFAIPGNHDYRLFPWRPNVYGLNSFGIPRSRLRDFLRRAGRWDPWPLRPSDFDALRTRDTSGPSTLAHHLTLLAPATDFSVTLDDLQLVFLNSGRDVLPRWRQVERARRSLLIRSIPGSWYHPDLEGFSDARLAGLGRSLDGAAAGTAVFFHAPLLHPPPRIGVESRIDRLDPGDDDSAGSRIRFERHLFSTGLRQGVFFRNPGPFVRALASARGPVATFSGHVHRGHAMELDPASLRVRTLGFDAAGVEDGHVTMLNAPALGQTEHRQGERPGYLLGSFDRGRLTSVERREIARR